MELKSRAKALAMFIEAALRHADLPDNPGIQEVDWIDGDGYTIGVRLEDGSELFVEVTEA